MRSLEFFAVLYFLYGLSFLGMGLAVVMELGHEGEPRLKQALWPLAVFGLTHGLHECLVMFLQLGLLTWNLPSIWSLGGLSLALLVASFVAMGAAGAALLAPATRVRLMVRLVPLGLLALWGAGGALLVRGFGATGGVNLILDTWARYALAVPGSLALAAGLSKHGLAYARAGNRSERTACFVAAGALVIYGLVGQAVTRPSPILVADWLSTVSFERRFGIPVQLVRASTSILVAIFVVRLLRLLQAQVRERLTRLQRVALDLATERGSIQAELLRQSVEAREGERKRIARELHDETGQALTALGLGLRGVEAQVRQQPERAAATVRNLQDLTARSLDELQRLIADLAPSHLDDLGLAAALRWYVADLRTRTETAVVVEITGLERDLLPTVRVALFRIVQEALGNCLRHAQAHRVRVHLEYRDAAVALAVEDDGQGFTVPAPGGAPRRAWGLIGMEERTRLVGGTYALDSAPGRGTRIEVVVPYDPSQNSREGT